MIIGRKHILTAGHCYPTAYAIVGAHDTKTTGQKYKVSEVHGMDQYGDIVNYQDYTNYESVISNYPTNVVDIAILTLESDIEFGDTVSKARLDYPSDECKTCDGYCGSSWTFQATGWGWAGYGSIILFF